MHKIKCNLLLLLSGALGEYAEGGEEEQTPLLDGEPLEGVVEDNGQGEVVTIKSENNAEHEVGLGHQHHQLQQQNAATGYASSVDGGGDGVGVLEAGRPEMKNGVLVESNVNEAVDLNVPADPEDDPNTTYTLHQLGYSTQHIIHERYFNYRDYSRNHCQIHHFELSKNSSQSFTLDIGTMRPFDRLRTSQQIFNAQLIFQIAETC